MWASSPTALNRTRFVRLPYVKYSTGADRTTRTVYRAFRRPDQTAARRAFFAGRTFGEWYAESKCLFRRVSAISRPNGLFFHIFSVMTEKIWPAARRMRLRKPHRASSAFEMHRQRHPTPLGCRKRAAGVCRRPHFYLLSVPAPKRPDSVQHRKDHDAHVGEDRGPHVRNTNCDQREAAEFDDQ